MFGSGRRKNTIGERNRKLEAKIRKAKKKKEAKAKNEKLKREWASLRRG